jgi:hypothetical protein
MRLRPRPIGHARRCRRGPRGVLAAALAASLLGHAAPARADVVISPIFDSSITNDPNAATIEATINQAIQVYETRFSDPITVSIRFQEVSTGLGASSTFVGNITYSQWRNALVANSTTGNDATALANLPTGSVNPVNGNANVTLTTANFRALGINMNPPGGQPDSTISLNTSLMNLNRSPINPNKFDLMAVASHEIDEALGIGSALTGRSNGSPAPTGAVSPGDMFRYDQNGNRSFTTNINAQAFFSIDGGTTDLARFNQDASGDFNDWYSPGGQTPQVQDAIATPGATPNLGVELTVLDVLGYDLVGVPEPTSLALFGAVVVVASGYGWRRRTWRDPARSSR